MGANLSTLEWKDTSKVVISAADGRNTKILGALWLGALYGCAMIWFAMALLARWDRAKKTGFGSVIGAFVLSTAWPVIMVFLLMNPE